MTKKTVLVVEDHVPTREAYATFLVECGYRVLEASHGGEAILQVHRHHPDLVLMDIALPVLDGVETAESLRAHASGTTLRILGVTACESAVKRKRMEEVCDELLLKPCAPDLVADRIRSLIGVAA